jgi:hypothetical protein
MKVCLLSEVVEVPDEIGAKLFAEQEAEADVEHYISKRIYNDPWTYEVKVPYRWEKVDDKSD